jgi:hypothetical protein
MSITSTAHAPASTKSRSATRRVLRHGALAGVVALPVIEAYAALAKAAGIPLEAGLPGTHTATLVTAGSFATGIVIATFWGTLLAIHPHPLRQQTGTNLHDHRNRGHRTVADHPARCVRRIAEHEAHPRRRPPDRREHHDHDPQTRTHTPSHDEPTPLT